ncbi:MAG: AMP-dependent synthetase [Opitutaceae bacterium]|nr:AMP-dependent synthetase [Opitutaceae bacterium]
MLYLPSKNLVEQLHCHAREHAGRPAVTFLPDGETGAHTLTYDVLDARARALAVRLRTLAAPGESLLLLYPAGLDFVVSFFACLYAGNVAIAAYPPRNARHMPRIDAILADAQVRTILTTRDARQKIEPWLGVRAGGFTLLCTDELDAASPDDWTPPLLTPDSVALLQYSSGSTGTPRGVVITHGNIMANSGMIRSRFGYHDQSTFVSWLPIYHDMGLIGNLLQPLYLGTSTVLMSPVSFLQRPVRWLAAISQYRARTTGAPNFAFDLCARVVTAEQKATLDLSSLELIYSGSEPIDARALDRFAEAFASCGLRRGALYACYGMAESTLLATGGTAGAGVRCLDVDADSLAAHRPAPASEKSRQRMRLVSCGVSVEGQDLRIVDPATATVLAENQVGEIWLRGPHIAPAYWGKPDVTEQVMRASLADGSGPWLRTGDLGFLREGELYVTGRIKDVIIIRGKNHYPQDIERTIELSHPALQAGACSAFALTLDGGERLGLAVEVQRTALKSLAGEEVAAAIRRAVMEEHELTVHAIALLRPVTLPKTSSGKLQRFAARDALQSGTLESVFLWREAERAEPATESIMPSANSSDDVASPPGPLIPGSGHDHASRSRADEIIAWLREYADTRINSRLMDERRSIPPYIVLDFGNQGILGLQAPRAIGGAGLTYRDTLRVAVQMGAIDINLSSFIGVHNALGLRPIMHYGTAAMHANVLPRLASGRELVAFAFTEPGAGSNPRAIGSTATPDGAGGWRLHGSKKWIGTGTWAGWIVVAAHLRDEAGSDRGITAFLLRQGAPGLRMGTEELTMGMRGMVQNTVHLEGVRVGPEDILGQPGQGMFVAQETMKFGRLFISTVSLGTLQRCVQLMLRYAAHRPMSTGRLLDNVISRDRISDHIMRIAAHRTLITQFGGWYDAGLDIPEEFFALVKYVGPESLGIALDHLIQMFGGRGYIETSLVPQLYRDGRLLRIFEGPTETMVMFLGSRVASRSRPLDDFLRTQLRAPAIADQVFAAAEVAKKQHLVQGDLAEQPLGVQRVSKLLGEFGIYALWLAVTEADPTTDDVALNRGRRWLRHELAESYARLSQPIAGHAVPFKSAEILAFADEYRTHIGDVEQHCAGEEHALDPLLRRAPANGATGMTLPPAQTAAATFTPAPLRPMTSDGNGQAPSARATEIETWLRTWIGARLVLPATQIDPQKPFSDFGVDSLTAVELSVALGDWLKTELPTTLTWDFPNIRALAAGVATPAKTPTPAAAPAPALPLARTDAVPDLEKLSEADMVQLLAAELATLRSEPTSRR